MVGVMDVTQKCVVSGKYGFELANSNCFAILGVEAKNGDLIRVNEVDGLRYKEIWDATEQPRHEDRPIIDDGKKIIVVGGEAKKTKRLICVVGK